MPTEQLLLKQNQSEWVREIRNFLVNGLKPELKQKMEEVTGQLIQELYMDWNLENETELFLAVTSQGTPLVPIEWPEEGIKKQVMENVIRASKSGLKESNRTDLYWLDGYALLVEQSSILTDLERRFIKNGLIDELRVAKCPLEHRLMESTNIASVLKQKIRERFVDWNFDHDKVYMMLILEPKNNEV